MLYDAIQTLTQHPLVLVAILLTLTYLYMSRSSTPQNLPPMPEKPYPFVGHILMMQKNPREKMKQWVEKSGDIFSIYIGNQLTIVLSGYDIIKDALVKRADIFSHRPQFYIHTQVPDSSKGVLTSSGENWKEQRTVTLSILRAFGMGKNSLAEKISEEVQEYLNALSELKGEPSDVRTLTNNCVSNVICNIIFGKRFELGDPKFVHLLDILNEQVKILGDAIPLNVWPWLDKLPGDPFKGKRMKSNYLEVRKYLDMLSEPLINNVDENNIDSLVAAYVVEMRKRQDKGIQTTMDFENLSSGLIGLFAAGSETTSTTIIWFVLLMMHHTDVFQKICKELDNVVGKERLPSIHDKSKMNYTNAVIMETLRIASIVPFSLQHECIETTTLAGYTIPKGTTIMPNLDHVLSDEKIWGDPQNFRPERFLDDKGALKSQEEFVPFSLGRRLCLGESLAKMELFLFITGICQRFDIQPAQKGNLPPLESVFGVTSPPKAYQARFIDKRSR